MKKVSVRSARGGPESVRVEQLARSLGVTKGGFYWYFDDRLALLDEMLDAWERIGVDDVVEAIDARGGDARARLRQVSMRTSGRGIRLDLAFRDWARRDRKVASRMKRVDNRRMEYLRSLFGEICNSSDEAEVRSMLMYSLWISNPLIAADHGTQSRRHHIINSSCAGGWRKIARMGSSGSGWVASQRTY